MIYRGRPKPSRDDVYNEVECIILKQSLHLRGLVQECDLYNRAPERAGFRGIKRDFELFARGLQFGCAYVFCHKLL